MDLNYDEKCRDAVYRRLAVSQQPNPPNPNPAVGFDGLFNSQPNPPGPNTDFFEFNGGVMVWSLGIDRQFDAAVKANTTPSTCGDSNEAAAQNNAMNVLSFISYLLFRPAIAAKIFRQFAINAGNTFLIAL